DRGASEINATVRLAELCHAIHLVATAAGGERAPALLRALPPREIGGLVFGANLRMHLAGLREHVLDAFLDRLVDEARHLGVAVEAKEHALVAEVAPRRVREVADRQVRVEV